MLHAANSRYVDPIVTAAQTRAERGQAALRSFLEDGQQEDVVECALRIHAVESELYQLFGRGKLHGTIHTCIGQEFSAAFLKRHLRKGDKVTSNHRCHGHFIAATGAWRGLIDEIVGNREGVCAGIGSSQHLWAENFISNGQQAGLVPVGAGLALDAKLHAVDRGGDCSVAVSFIGDGTLGEGVLYETLNIDSLWNLPHIVVCENNLYSQSTPQATGVAGSIGLRAKAFGLEVIEADTWNLPQLDAAYGAAFQRARELGKPTFLVVTTYRLNPHSKGDDLRQKEELAWFRDRDPVEIALRAHPELAARHLEMSREVAAYAEEALQKPTLSPQDYFPDQLPRPTAAQSSAWKPAALEAERTRYVKQLNAYYNEYLERDSASVFLGEDIEDPYGGAFKIAKDLSSRFSQRVRTTPISEAAIVGIGVGLSIAGRRAFVEIMFGDFITYAFDQIVNNASKMHHMYNRHIDCPVVVRTPMGGRRGYGPTHSQSLERFLIGIDNCCCISINALTGIQDQLVNLPQLRCPVVLIENKTDYTATSFVAPDGYVVELNEAPVPTVRVRPIGAEPSLTLVAYGGSARLAGDALLDIFEQCDVVPELIALGSLSPIDTAAVAASVEGTGRLVTIEEGSGNGSVGGELLAQLMESGLVFACRRVYGRAVPPPSAPALESATLPSLDDIRAAIVSLMESERGH